MRSDGELMLGGLLRNSHTASFEDIVPLLNEHAPMAGFSNPMVYVSDLQQKYLVPLPNQFSAGGEPLTRLNIDTTIAGRAFRNVELVHARPDEDLPPCEQEDGLRLWSPLLDGTERVGVVGGITQRVDEVIEWRFKRLSTLLSLLVVSKRQTSDTYSRMVREKPMTLSAEVLHNLLPNGSFANDEVVIAAALEPAYQVGGDVFEYGIEDDQLHVSIFDAMGHDLASGLTASIAVGSCRSNRLKGAGLVAISEAIDEAIAQHFQLSRFATGIIANLDMSTGTLSWVNRGHHPALVVRNGKLAATLGSAKPAPPMGFRLGRRAEVEHYQLHAGDRLLFYTDGIVEARSPEGEPFGLERFIDYIVRREADGLPAPETLRRLIQSIMRYQRGRLQDDATVLTVEWMSGRRPGVTL
ncbi:PP2C family protein-serine/threonine phosphatase [Nonomuraea harbinensis]|uniref:PP2C family protein-serine/threonine phosphatase n=1 Tax=Nonomuraea harbinensis TaxID=1286938 RepID=A0ABW1C166_9ACTN|nr:PP2C family protein-serine/threonine phosphatase [Nonomuraea harbinensis]